MFAPENAGPIRQPAPSDSDPTATLAANTLHSVLLLALPFCILFLGVAVPLFAIRKMVTSLICAATIVEILVCKVLLKRGYVRLSSWIFVSTIWLVLAVSVALSGGIRSPAVSGHIAVIAVSVWLLGRREALWISIFSLVFGLSLAILEKLGMHLPVYFPNPPLITWMFGVGLVSLAILPLAHVNRALADSAAQARRELKTRLYEEQAARKAMSDSAPPSFRPPSASRKSAPMAGACW
jgi:hypothetical protein